jgi:hypothetical protein
LDPSGNLKKAADKAFGDPSALLQTMSVALLLLSFVAVLGGWIFGIDLKVPLVLFGILTILLLLLLNSQKMSTTGGAGLILALGLVGTIIAREDFIIRIMHMWRGQPASLGEYRQVSTTDVRAVVAPRDTKEEIIALVRQELSSSLKPETERKIEKVVERGEIEGIADRVASLEFLLLDIAKEGREASRRFVGKYGIIDAFRADMRRLQAEGIIKYERDDLGPCDITSLGKRVAEVVRARQSAVDRPVQTEEEPSAR